MSGIFSLFSGGRSGRQTTQRATDEREAQVVEIGDPLAISSHRRIEVDNEFRPVEHPAEPISQDQPVRCPLSEPSILNDGRIWKERMSSTSAPMRADLLVVKKVEREGSGRRHKSAPRSRPSSLSATGDSNLKLPEECNKVAGDGTTGS